MAFLIALNSIFVAQIVGGEEASLFDLAQALALPLALATAYANIAISVKRLHDIDWTGLAALLTVVPFINVLFAIWIGILPGTAGPNRFGPRADAPPP